MDIPVDCPTHTLCQLDSPQHFHKLSPSDCRCSKVGVPTLNTSASGRRALRNSYGWITQRKIGKEGGLERIGIPGFCTFQRIERPSSPELAQQPYTALLWRHVASQTVTRHSSRIGTPDAQHQNQKGVVSKATRYFRLARRKIAMLLSRTTPSRKLVGSGTLISAK